MERMYKEYKNIVVFRIVYIKEAHAADSDWPVRYAKELGINEHKTYDDRCDLAKRLIDDKEIKIPAVIEKMNGKVDKAYSAAPTRAYLIRKDGRLGVTCRRGPMGLKPALKRISVWLKEYKETGKEPQIPPQEQAKDTESKPASEEKEK